MQSHFNYGIDKLTIGMALELVKGNVQGVLSSAARSKIEKSEADVREILSQDSTVYGVNTGFGILAQTRISAADAQLLQHKILQSHSVGVGLMCHYPLRKP